MMLFYYALRLDIAVGVLRDCHSDQWPRYWYRNMKMDVVSPIHKMSTNQGDHSDIQECAGWLIAAYAGRQSVPPPTSRNWFLLVNAGAEVEMKKVIQGSERLDRNILDSLGTLLPSWRHNNSWPTFGMDNTWWSYPLREYGKFGELHTTDKTFKRAHNYFNVSQF